MRCWLFLALVGCAQAAPPAGLGVGNNHPDAGNQVTLDSPSQQMDAPTQIDAPQIILDAAIDGPMAPTEKTLSETSSATDTNASIACQAVDSNQNTLWTYQNDYYRVFRLSDFGISGTFHVEHVDFVINYAALSPAMQLSVGTYSGTVGASTLNTSDITILNSSDFTSPNTTTSENYEVPITADVTGNLIVKLSQTADGTTGNRLLFFIGANTSSESEPGYIYWTQCSAMSAPTSMATEAGGPSSMLITVTGTY